MQGIAIQGLYLSSWINSYQLAYILADWMRSHPEVHGRLVLVQYVDNVLILTHPSLSTKWVIMELSKAIAMIGLT